MGQNSSTPEGRAPLGIRVVLDLPGGWRMRIRPPLESEAAADLVAALRQLQDLPWGGYYGHDFNPRFSAVLEERRAA